MNAARLRIPVLWLCTGLFLLRVLGQLEVVLIGFSWLPPMEHWYSGLLPYPLLLPAQIVILMLMTGLVVQQMLRPRATDANWLTATALIYFAVMILRLIIQYARGAESFLAAGGIPIVFHWILALFLLVLSKAPHSSARAVDRPYHVIERIQ
ncbi:MAG: hypothetical protein ABW171_11870 [Steroidobacter sp.]